MDEIHFEVIGADTRRWGEKGGSYSLDLRYRWRFERLIGSGPAICWIGLNPGTGDSEGRYRPTLQCMVDHSQRLGMGTFILVNLFSWRATNPRELRAATAAGHDIIGADTDQAIADAAARSEVVVAAWGHHGTLLGRADEVLRTLVGVQCLGVTSAGHPRHPLFVAASEPLRPLLRSSDS